MTSSCWNALTLNTSRLPHLPTALYPLYNVYTAVSLYLFDDNFTLQTLFLWCVYLLKIFSDSCVVITMFVLSWSTWCGRLVLPLKELELSCRRECLQCDRMVQMSIVDCMWVSAMWQDGADVDCWLYVCVCNVTGWCRCRLWIVCVCLQCDRMVQMSIVDCMCVSAMWQDGADVDCGLYVCVCNVTGWLRRGSCEWG